MNAPAIPPPGAVRSRTMHTYERDPYRTHIETTALASGLEGDQPYVVLADTVLYPEGGGQPADRGRIAGVAVLDVQKVDGAVRHLVASPVAPGPVTVELDWPRRFDHMQQHTAQHLLSAIALDRHGWRTTSFHLQAEICDIELATAELTPADLATLEAEVAAEVRAARPITARRVSPEDYAALPRVRTRGLPAGHVGDVRLVEIESIDLSTCGGTHLHSTAEIEAMKLLGSEGLRGGTRLFWLAGERVRRRLGTHEARNTELRSLLGCSDAELPAVLASKLEQLREAGRREKNLADQLATQTAEALLAAPGALLERHFEGLDVAFLQVVARRFAEAAHGKAALLTASGPKGHALALAAGTSSTLDVQAAGREIAALLGGRGGGSGRTFQGTAGALDGRQEAVEILRSRC